MSITIIFKIAAVGIVVTVLSQVLKHSGREEQSFLLSLAGLIIVLFWIVPYISDLFETMETLFGTHGQQIFISRIYTFVDTNFRQRKKATRDKSANSTTYKAKTNI